MAIGAVMIDLLGTVLSDEEKQLLQHPLVGGVIIFSRNYQSPRQLRALATSIRRLNPNLLLAVDQEGGRVQRFDNGFSRLPAMRTIGAYYDKDPLSAEKVAESCAWLMAAELLACGLDFSFAPVLDSDNGTSTVIGSRAFHHDVKIIARLAQCFITGFKAAGMAAVGKHFPGHGLVTVDSHQTIASVDEAMTAHDLDSALWPFKQLIAHDITAIMAAHIIFPRYDDKPASCSSYFLEKILREQCKFCGAIFSDDLTMAGASIVGDITTRCQLALSAGCDMVLVCNNREGVYELLAKLTDCRSELSQKRLANMQAKSTPQASSISAWQQACDVMSRFSDNK